MPEPVYRTEDEELVGYVEPAGPAGWRALTLFGGVLAEFGDRDRAVAELHARGLACLAQRWWYFSDAQRRWRRVQLVDVRPSVVRAVDGPYPQVAQTVRLAGAELASLTLALPEQPAGALPPDYGGWLD